MRRTRRAGWAAAAREAANTMAELSPRAETDQGENPCNCDAMTIAPGKAMAKPIEQLGGRAFHEQGVPIELPQGFGGCYDRSGLGAGNPTAYLAATSMAK